MDDIKSQGDAIGFINVPKAYMPQEDLTVRFERNKDVVAGTRDWVGLFRVGWTSIRDYYTFEWAPTTSNPADNKVVFSGRRLPPDDACFYQFCYVSREGVMRGASVPFQFTKPACGLNLDDVETVDVVEEGLESIVELRHKDTQGEGATNVTATATVVTENVQTNEITSGAIDDPRQTEYERVKEELAESINRIATLEADKGAAVQSNVDLAARLNDSQNLVKTLQDMHARLSERLDKEMTTCLELKTTNEKLNIGCQETEKVAGKLDAQCQQLSAEKADFIKQLNLAVQQRNSLEATLCAKLQAAKESRDQMEKMVEQSAHKMKELEEYLALRENELSTVHQQFCIEKQRLEKHLLEQQATTATMRQLEDKNQQLEAQLLKKQTDFAGQIQELQQKVQSAEELNEQLQAQLSESEHQLEVLAKERSDAAVMKNVLVPNEYNSQPFCTQPPSGYVDKAAHEALQVAYENMEKYYRKVNTELEGCHVQLRESEAKASKMSDQCDELKKRIELGRLAYENVARENSIMKRTLNNLGDQNKVTDFKQKTSEDDKMWSVATKTSKHMEQYPKKIGEVEESLKRQEKQYQQKIGEMEEMLKRQEKQYQQKTEELEEMLKRQEKQYQQKIGEMEEMLKRQEKQYQQKTEELEEALKIQACEAVRTADDNQRINELEQKLVEEKNCVEKLVQEKVDQENQYNVTLQEYEQQLSKKHAELESKLTKLSSLQDNCDIALQELTKRNTENDRLHSTIKQLGQDKQSLEAKFSELQKQCRTLSARSSEPPARRDNGPPYVPPPPPVRRPYTVPPRNVSQATYSTTRVCPVCQTKFPHRMLQSEFEQHVQAHFSV